MIKFAELCDLSDDAARQIVKGMALIARGEEIDFHGGDFASPATMIW